MNPLTLKAMRALTIKQKRIFDAIVNFMDVNDGLVPTHRDLATMLGCTRATVSYHINKLYQKGHIKRTRKWRDMELIKSESESESNSVSGGSVHILDLMVDESSPCKATQ